MMKHKILVATTNPGKLEELRELLGDVGRGIQWKCLKEFPGIPEVVEDGSTFAENARKKAIGYAKATGLWTLADDSGLVIDALNGAPGVLSARFAANDQKLSPNVAEASCFGVKTPRRKPCECHSRKGGEEAEGAGYKDRRFIDVANYQKVLRLLKDVPDSKRTARFVCHLCLAGKTEILLEATGTVEGVISHSPAGENGFGYDPIFYIPSLKKTVAQLENHDKNQISHRGSAIRKLKPLLENLLKANGTRA